VPDSDTGGTPLVHRAVRTGGVLIALASVQFVAAMIAVQGRYPGYSLTANYISDLGGAHSPWALVFDGSIILLGAIVLPSLFLVYTAFDPHPARSIGFVLLLVSAAGAIGVGVFPETTHVLGGQAHGVASFVTFVGAALGFIVLSFAMRTPGRWRLSGPYTLVSGVVSLVATLLFGAGVYLGIGPGGMERAIVAPVLLWMVLIGIHIGRLHRYAPGLRLPNVST
jgi:hypothetical membrane protein